MPIPIEPTPILEGEDLIRFLKEMDKVGRGEGSCGYVQTPNLWKAEELIKKYKKEG